MAKRKKKTAKKCRACGRRRKLDQYQPHPKTEDGLRHVCRDCQTTTAGRKKSAAKQVSDEAINAILAQVETVVGSQLMPSVTAVIRAMRASSTGRLVVDLVQGHVEIPRPQRFAIPPEDVE